MRFRREPQLLLPLRTRHTWGGAREKAGRKKSPHARMRHASRARFTRPLPAHVTLRLRRDVPSLRTVPMVRAIERTFADGCSRPGFRLVHYSLQHNHAQLIVEASDRDALGRGMMAVASRLARAVNRVTGRAGKVLADRYHHEMLPTPRQVHHTLRYVLLNARRHAAKAGVVLTGPVRLDRASSARWFEGWKWRPAPSRDGTTHAPDARPAVARARTWLLNVGWRRHGLLDPAEVPG